MKSPILPITCGVAVAAMCAAGLSHWWSVRELIALTADGVIQSEPLVTRGEPAPLEPAAMITHQQTPQAAPMPQAMPAPAEQQRFFEALVSRIENLQTQNRDLLDQLAETNRDLMKLEFRVDTHSASFRPLPVTEDQPFTSLDADLGVLPPRAEPVMLPPLE